MFEIKREVLIDSIAPLVRFSPEKMFKWKTNILKSPWFLMAKEQDLVEAETLMLVMLKEEKGEKEVRSIDFVKDFESLQEFIVDYESSDCDVHVLSYDGWNEIFKEVPIRLGVIIKTSSWEELELDIDYYSDACFGEACFLNRDKEDEESFEYKDIDSLWDSLISRVIYFNGITLNNLNLEILENKIENLEACDVIPFIEIVDGYFIDFGASECIDCEEKDCENCQGKDYLPAKCFFSFPNLDNAQSYARCAVKEIAEDIESPVVTVSDIWFDYVIRSDGACFSIKDRWRI